MDSYLDVRVLGARGLTAKDRGGTSDPYCVLAQDGGRGGDVFTTEVLPACQSFEALLDRD